MGSGLWGIPEDPGGSQGIQGSLPVPRRGLGPGTSPDSWDGSQIPWNEPPDPWNGPPTPRDGPQTPKMSPQRRRDWEFPPHSLDFVPNFGNSSPIPWIFSVPVRVYGASGKQGWEFGIDPHPEQEFWD